MPMIIRQHRTNPRGRHYDPKRPLLVCRRIPMGPGASMLPGQAFDPAGLPALRVAALFRGRFIGHELPRGVKPIAPVQAPPAADPPPHEPKPAKRPRAGA